MDIIIILAISWWLTNFEPLTNLLFKFESKINNNIIKLMTCWKCNSFWMSIGYVLITLNNFYLPFVVAMIAWIIDNIVNK